MTSENKHKIPNLKIPELIIKSNHHKTDSFEPISYRIKESHSHQISTDEPINVLSDVKLFKVDNSKNFQSINSSTNESTSRTHKQINSVPVLKQREKKNQTENLNPNIKRIQKSTFKKAIRYDTKGTEINHKNKKIVKITFRDELEGQNFCDYVDIENFKEYMKGGYGKVDRKDIYVRSNCSSCGCNIY
jgi:hypothetical protein